MTPNRKRGRNLQEDEVEFMPLSKRINNLHILENPYPWGPGPPPHYVDQQPHLPDTPPSSVQSPNWNIPQYTPDLSETQNPHYFNINKLLFEMYVQRLERGCQQG